MPSGRRHLLSSWWTKKKSLSTNSSFITASILNAQGFSSNKYISVDREGHARHQIYFPPRVLLVQYYLNKNRALSISLYIFILYFASIYKCIYFWGRGSSLAFVCCFSPHSALMKEAGTIITLQNECMESIK